MEDQILSVQDAYPRKIVFATAVGCGLLLALAMHLIGASLELGLVSLWNTEPGSIVPATAAIAWWLIAATGFVGGYGAGLITSPSPSNPVSASGRRILTACFVIVLAGAGLASSGPQSGPGFASVLSGLSTLLLGTGVSMCGVHFATRNGTS